MPSSFPQNCRTRGHVAQAHLPLLEAPAADQTQEEASRRAGLDSGKNHLKLGPRPGESWRAPSLRPEEARWHPVQWGQQPEVQPSGRSEPQSPQLL